MRIGVTSNSKLKLDAVKSAYSFMKPSPEIIGYAADSGVGEQPVEEQTLLGARKRIRDVKDRGERLDRIISIENGIFKEGDDWLDRAVVVIYDPQKDEEHIAYSNPIVFPNEYVENARRIGFDRITVGKVMADEGVISDPKDPHISISGISRLAYIEETIRNLVDEFEKKQKG